MNIAYLLGGFKSGGIARVTSILANKFAESDDMNIFLISYVDEKGQELYCLSPKIGRLFLFDKSVSMKRAIFFKKAVTKLRKMLNENNIDTLVCCDAIFFPLGVLACKKTTTKCFCWEHTSPLVFSDHKYQNFCRKFALKRCDKFITLTQFAKQFYLENFPSSKNKIEQIYNPIDPKCIKSNLYNVQSKKIISVGRLSYPKNFERLISICQNLLSEYPDWSLDIYGEGELREELQKQINNSCSKSQITLKGQINNLYSVYKDYSFCVMTSRYEGFPMSLIEAAANKLPIISFDIKTGPNEIIQNGINGFLIDPDSDLNMKNAITTLITDNDMRDKMSYNSFELIQKFTIDKIAEEWKDLFCKIQNK